MHDFLLLLLDHYGRNCKVLSKNNDLFFIIRHNALGSVLTESENRFLLINKF